MLLKVCDNDKLEMEPLFLLFVMTFIRVVMPSIYSRCKSNISKMMYRCHYQKRDTREAVDKTEDKILVAEFLTRSENSNELL